MRAALRVFLDSLGRFDLVGEADNGIDAIALVRSTHPDVVLMDVQMPKMDGIEATQRLTREFPGIKIVALTTFSSERVIVPMLSAGAAGFLVRTRRPTASSTRRASLTRAGTFFRRASRRSSSARCSRTNRPHRASSAATRNSPNASWKWSRFSRRECPTARSPRRCSVRSDGQVTPRPHHGEVGRARSHPSADPRNPVRSRLSGLTTVRRSPCRRPRRPHPVAVREHPASPPAPAGYARRRPPPMPAAAHRPRRE